MAKDACLECGKRLPANKELASVPNGRLVAFDPQANRVWRICAKCHHWNLLGPEASAAALPELVARFEGLSSAGPEGLAKAKVSDKLDLFRVGGPQERAARILALVKARHEIVSDAAKGASLIVMSIFAWQAWNTYHLVQEHGPSVIAAIALATGVVGVTFRPAYPKVNWFDRNLPWPLVLLGGSMTAAGWLALGWAAAATGLGVVLGLIARRHERRSDVLEWTPGLGDLKYREGSSTIDMLEVPLLLDPDTVTIEQATEAIDRFEQLGDLASALRCVSVERGEPEGRLPFRDLSDEHKLLLAIAARIATVEPRAEISAGLPSARVIAGLAESLHRPHEGA